jgi:GNAT superfamily N-acetyltransferase
MSMPGPPAAQVRPFVPADAEAVATVIATTMRESNARDYPRAQLEALVGYFTPAKLRQLGAERDCFVALVEGRVIGTAAREGARLVTFFVLPDWQGRGVGAALLDAVERAARAAGIAELAVAASLTGAGFYRRHGYRETHVVHEGPAAPQVALVKALGDAAG